MIVLVNLVGGKVGDVDVGVKARLKRRADGAQLIPNHAVKEGVLADLGAAVLAGRVAEAVRGVAEETSGGRRRG